MGFKIKNSLTGEFEKLPILTLKGEKGETGGVEEYNKVDYMGNKYETLKQANDANVEYAVKTAIGEFNYLDYEGQNITALDTLAGQAKNAVVEGQTLVNLYKITESTPYTYKKGSSPLSKLTVNLLANKTYLILLDFSTVDKDGKEKLEFFPMSTFIDGTRKQESNFSIGKNGRFTYKYTPSKDVISYMIIIGQNNFEYNNPTVVLKSAMIIEYQEGMENWDIPYFEGMTSVKAPVLKSVGKNLVNVDRYTLSCGSGVALNGHKNTVITKNIKVKPNTTYTFSYGKTVNVPSEVRLKVMTLTDMIEDKFNVHVDVYSHKNRIKEHSVPNGGTFTTESHDKYIAITTGNFTTTGDILIEDIQIEESSVATPYEPYKTNFLTAKEDVVLRGIGNVKDTLDISTEEKVERIEEITFKSSDGWLNSEATFNNVYEFKYPLQRTGKNGIGISNNFIQGADGDYERFNIYNKGKTYLYLCINKSKLSSNTIDALNDYLQSNPLTVQYQLLNESIKTVDLSDNHVYSYDNITHYDCSSAEGSLVPTLSVKVPTDVQATIARQRETIQTLNSENERLNQIQEALKASMLDSQVQLMNLSWDTDFEVFTLRESIAPKDFLMDSRTGSNIDKFSQAKFIIENDCPDLEKLNSQIEYYFSKDVFSQEQFEELTDLISIVKGENGCEY